MSEAIEVDVSIYDTNTNIVYTAMGEESGAAKHWSAGTLARVVIDLASALVASSEKHFLSPREKRSTAEEEVYLVFEKIIELHNKRFE